MSHAGPLVALFGVAVVGAIGFDVYYELGTHETERFTVVQAFETVTGSGESSGKEKRIKVIMDNGCYETFTVEDSLLNGQWYSSNLHAMFADAAAVTDPAQRKTYEATTVGWRSGFWSMMENVIQAREIEGATPFQYDRNNPACRL